MTWCFAGSWIGPESKPAPLRSRALIQIGPRLFYFLLPKQAEKDLSSSEDEVDLLHLLFNVGLTPSPGCARPGSSSHVHRLFGKEMEPNSTREAAQSHHEVSCRSNQLDSTRLLIFHVRYGYGRWKLLEDAVGDPEFSRQNIEVFATQLVYQLKQHCGKCEGCLSASLISIG